MKKFVLFFVSVLLATNLSSCTKFVKPQVDDEENVSQLFVMKEQKWGMIDRQAAVVIWPWGKCCYGWEKKSLIGESWNAKPVYDSITVSKAFQPLTVLYIGWKGGHKYYYGANGQSCAEGKAVAKIEYAAKNTCCFGTAVFKLVTETGECYLQDAFVNSPPYVRLCEDARVEDFGYAVKLNGKWGYIYGRHDVKRYDETGYVWVFKEVLPCIYDEVKSDFSSDPGQNKVMGRQGRVWTTVRAEEMMRALDKGKPRQKYIPL